MDFEDLEKPASTPQARNPSRFMPRLNKGGKLQPKKEPAPLASVVKSDPGTETVPDVKPVFFPKPEPLDEMQLVSVPGADSEAPAAALLDGVLKMAVEDAEASAELMEVDEEDYVVREIDVYFNPKPVENTQLYLMQYPLRPSWRPYELDERCKEVRVKPKSVKVEIDIEVDVDSRSQNERFLEANTMTKTLASSGKLSQKTGYAIGVLQGNKLHLNPIHAAVQLRPCNGDDDNDDEEEEDEDKDKNDKKNPEEKNKKRPAVTSKEQSKMTTLAPQRMTEPWVPLKYHSSRSNVSENYLQKLMIANSSPVQFSMSPSDYADTFCPGRSDDNKRQTGMSKRSLLGLPLEERLRKLLCEGSVQAYRFSVLKHYAPEVSAEDVIEILKKLALLVQGLWVAKTTIIWPGCSMKEEIVRDFLMFKFSQKTTIKNNELSNFKNDISQILRKVLDKLAIQRPDIKDWRFKEPGDPSFAKLYPEVTREQEKLFKENEQNIMACMYKYRNWGSQNAAKTVNPAPTKKVLMSDEKREALQKALEILFKQTSVNSFETICRGLRELALSTSSISGAEKKKWMVVAAKCVEEPRQELENVIGEFTTSVHGVYVAKSSPNNADFNSQRDIVIKLFSSHPPGAKFKKAFILQFIKQELDKEVTNNDYNKIMSELCESRNAAWMMKTPR